MDHRKTSSVLLFLSLAGCLIAFTPSDVEAKLTPGQARRALTRMAGFELTSGSVRVKTISTPNAAAAEVLAEIKTVFKFVQDNQGGWRVAEIRTGQDRWEQIDLIANSLRTQVATGACTTLDPPVKGRLATDPSVKRARCLLGNILGIEIPSDGVRIQLVEPMLSSATVVAWVKVDARLLNDKTGWRVSELRTGNRDWVKLDSIVAALNGEKQKLARAEMELIASALEKFRKDRGFYVVSDSQATAIDHLSPRYLVKVIREDPWQQPYKYLGESHRFTLRSAGPDRKPDTPDDILLVSPSR